MTPREAPMTLLEQCQAELTRRLDLCDEATHGPWLVDDYNPTRIDVDGPAGGWVVRIWDDDLNPDEIDRANAAFVAAHDPSTMTVLYEAIQEWLPFHEECDDTCPEVRMVATALALHVEAL